MKLTKVEINRKLIHLSSAIFPVAYYFWFQRHTMTGIMTVIALVFFTVEYLRLRGSVLSGLLKPIFGLAIRSHETDRLTGAAFVFLGNLVVIALFPKMVAIPALLVLAVSDTAAALVGIPCGKHRLGNKSLEGSTAFFIVSLGLLALFPNIPWIGKFGAAAIGTIVEALINYIDDNITIPLAVAATISLFMAL